MEPAWLWAGEPCRGQTSLLGAQGSLRDIHLPKVTGQGDGGAGAGSFAGLLWSPVFIPSELGVLLSLEER